MGREHLLLPPVNEVWGKVILFAPLCHSVHWGGGEGFCPPPVRRPGGGGACPTPTLGADLPHPDADPLDAGLQSCC